LARIRPTLNKHAREEEGTMNDDRVAQETHGVTVELLTTVDLGSEIPGLDGHQLRLRKVTIEALSALEMRTERGSPVTDSPHGSWVLQ
jgi:hypothetical protein